MAKIVCENARVKPFEIMQSGRIEHTVLFCKPDCPICHGAGYTEEAVVKVSDVESNLSRFCTSYRLDEDEIWEEIWLWVRGLKEQEAKG